VGGAGTGCPSEKRRARDGCSPRAPSTLQNTPLAAQRVVKHCRDRAGLRPRNHSGQAPARPTRSLCTRAQSRRIALRTADTTTAQTAAGGKGWPPKERRHRSSHTACRKATRRAVQTCCKAGPEGAHAALSSPRNTAAVTGGGVQPATAANTRQSQAAAGATAGHRRNAWVSVSSWP
jgi:hypothetical protein